MKIIAERLKEFEKRNNLSVSLTIHSDGSGNLGEFWDNEKLFEFKDENELYDLLENINYKKSDDGRCLSPVEIV